MPDVKAQCVTMDMCGRAHVLLDYVTEHGGTVELNNRAFNKFVHRLWDIWEDGYNQGQADEEHAELEQLRAFIRCLPPSVAVPEDIRKAAETADRPADNTEGSDE